MKLLILVLSVLSISIFSFANHHEEGKGKGKGKMNIEARKAKVTANIDKRIAALTEFKTCVGNAKAKGDMKTCRQAHKSSMQALKMEKKGH